MKSAKLGDFLLWKGALAKIVGTTDHKQVIIEMVSDTKCPHCGESIGKNQFSVIENSQLLQENA